MQPSHAYPKRILLAVSGMSPQIVTETLYGLAIGQGEPFIPTEIHLITTVSGAREARLQLLHPKTGKFHQLRQDYQLPDIDFPEENIHVIEDTHGQPLDDIKTPTQNEAAADFITAIVCDLTRHDDAAIHVSIAGGRKTMGYYLGYALSLYGRLQDRLSHVLVTDRYENLPEFFYPTPNSQVIFDRENRALDSQEAKIMLAEIPFVRLRSGMPDHLLKGRIGFSESIRLVRRIESEPILRIDQTQQCFWVGDVKIRMTAVNFVFYLWLLRRSLEDNPVKRGPYAENREYAAEFTALFKQHLDKDEDDRTLQTLKQGMHSDWLSERISRCNTSFQHALGKAMAQPFAIKSRGKNNDKHYRIDLTQQQIQPGD
ncbi:MAG: TIGR02584 family CRISPR-associated protein [Methylomonas sp.]|nr:TIGR02584 family CRISPR-associated protein [Methylomonas sp.]PPD21133.1 MAG: TIGR02584 family CRISPR-associated protein [Methylomonas sp.]PPD27567.1 MAG: TIGR02584 family CRISPR-associated protein [Methylomonas sp.]PPD39563.1 MAG: TIGR02584 family CRISPR-associated protein [Methylomonas sp.]PPD55814.1 MAG: TIGR02584 family CRISPR-associated protein [Methylomonas sp.]